MAGILGYMAAGAAAGGAQAYQKFHENQYQNQGKLDLTRETSKIEEARARRLAELQQTYARENNATRFENESTLQNRNFAQGLLTEGVRNQNQTNQLETRMEHERALLAEREGSAERRHKENLGLRKDEMELRERLATANSGTINQTKDGAFTVIKPDGTSVAVTGPDGKPVIGKSQMSQERVLMAKAYFDQAETTAKNMLDPDAQKKAAEIYEKGIKILKGQEVDGPGGGSAVKWGSLSDTDKAAALDELRAAAGTRSPDRVREAAKRAGIPDAEIEKVLGGQQAPAAAPGASDNPPLMQPQSGAAPAQGQASSAPLLSDGLPSPTVQAEATRTNRLGRKETVMREQENPEYVAAVRQAENQVMALAKTNPKVAQLIQEKGGTLAVQGDLQALTEILKAVQ